MRMKLAVKGLESFKKKLENLKQLQGFEAELDSSAQAVASAAVENLDQMVSEKSSGKLASSLTVTSDGQGFSRIISTKLKYAAFVEFGTVRTPPRPWLGSALAAQKDTIKQRLGNLLLSNAARK